MWNQWKIFEKMTTDLNHVLFWAQKYLEILFLRPMFNIPLKYLNLTCKPWGMWNQWKFLMTKDQNFYLFWGPKWPKDSISGAQIFHTSKNICSENVKVYWCETNENFLRMWPKSRILAYFWVQNSPKNGHLRPILYTYLKVAQMNI